MEKMFFRISNIITAISLLVFACFAIYMFNNPLNDIEIGIMVIFAWINIISMIFSIFFYACLDSKQLK